MKTDDVGARALLGPMLDETVPPSKVEVSRLVAAGRSRVRVRRWAGISGAGALTAVALIGGSLLVQPNQPPAAALQTATSTAPSPATGSRPAPPAFPTSCTGRLLPVPGKTISSYISGGDPSGRYLVGGYATDTSGHRPVLWDNGNPVIIPAPGGDLVAIEVNDRGIVAGTTDKIGNGTVEQINWVYRDGRVSPLGEPATKPGTFIQVIDINSGGDILLDSRPRTGVDPNRGPGIWTAAGQGTFRPLADPGNLGELTASALDEDGTVVGRYLVGQGFEGERTLVWKADGQLTKPSPPAGYGPGGALRLVRGGFAVGYYQQPGKQPHEVNTVRRDLRTGIDTAIPALAGAGAVNAHGWVAGLIRESGQGQTPAITTGTQLIKLPLPAGAIASSDGVGAYHLSDDGRTVAGNVAVNRDYLGAAVWRCLP
ncbi:hypothetical protein [Rhizocola hellebori]|uniref:hypothetical protein n=1 Tax=Rhizocola hellebori TaxID=1392758 RepID=UPI001942880B|nr:hypothetical protein [Rhizocola hellebori]